MKVIPFLLNEEKSYFIEISQEYLMYIIMIDI